MAHNEFIYLYDRIGDYDLAMEWANKYIALAPSEPNPYDTRGEIFAGYGKLVEAIESYEKVYSIKPGFYDYQSLFTLGRLHVYNRNYTRAKELFLEAINDGDKNIRSIARTNLALISLYRGHFEEALGVLNDGISADNMDFVQVNEASLTKYIIKIYILTELGNFQEARSELNRAIEMQDEASDGIRFDFKPIQCFLYGSEGNLEMVEKIAGDPQLKDKEADQHSYWKVMAREEYFKGDFDESIRWLSKLSSEETMDFDDNYLLGKAYMESGKYSEAVDIFEGMLTDYYNRWRLIYSIRAVKSHYYLGLAYDNMDQFEKAVKQYKLFTGIWQESEPTPASVIHALERLAYFRKHL
jgi:tetratricopeptide (TPR) repeat protein